MLIEESAIRQAAARLREWLEPTPLVRSRPLSERTGANVYLKLDMLQPTHSFKVRGAFNALARLPPAQRAQGVITASGGNHGLAVAYAARTLGLRALIFLPAPTSDIRIRAVEAAGAEVVLHGAAWDEANVRALEVAAQTGMTYVHPFDNADVMAGQGTLVSELVDQLPRIDALVASIGGGGLLSGILSAVHAYTPRTRVIGVETEGANSMYQSWKAGHIVELPRITSIAETLGARRTTPRPFDIVTRHAADLVTVTDEQAIRALLRLLRDEKLLTEPAASCSVAAVIEGKIPVRRDEHLVIVLCGANIALDRVCQWMASPGLDSLPER
jgi:threonine dehydratase